MRHAFLMLKSLSGRWHRVVTGVALFHIQKGRIQKKNIFSVISRVYIRKMTEKEINSYLKKIHPLDKAGAYAIQDGRVSVVLSVRGSKSNVAGLPMEELIEKLRHL
jgi:septum formation protein